VLLVEVRKAGRVSRVFISDTMKLSSSGRYGMMVRWFLAIDVSLYPHALDLLLQAFRTHPMGGWFCSFLHYFIAPGTDPLWGFHGIGFFAIRYIFISMGHKIFPPLNTLDSSVTGPNPSFLQSPSQTSTGIFSEESIKGYYHVERLMWELIDR